MPERIQQRRSLTAIVVVAAGFLLLAGLNLQSKREAAALPAEYLSPYFLLQYESENMPPSRRILRFDGERVSSASDLAFLLTLHRAGDTVIVLDERNGTPQTRTIVLRHAFRDLDLVTYLFVGAVFLLFALAVVLRYRQRTYAPVLLGVAFATAAMVLADWGSLAVHAPPVNFILRFVFDASIWLVPALFFHFSCSYPRDKGDALRRPRCAFYGAAALGMLASLVCLAAHFLFGVSLRATPYVTVHGTVNDVFIVLGLLATVANFEHSALTIRSAHERRSVYWVLLGVIFGPLVFVFLILVPRILVGSEFVSDTVMECTLLLAPAMFWKALRNSDAPLQS